MTAPAVGEHYRAKASGSVYALAKILKSGPEPYAMRLIEFSRAHREEVRADAERDGKDVGFALQRARARKMRVERAWFEHAAKKVEVTE